MIEIGQQYTDDNGTWIWDGLGWRTDSIQLLTGSESVCVSANGSMVVVGDTFPQTGNDNKTVAVVASDFIAVGNTSTNTMILPTGIKSGNNSPTANGYTYLPNGFLIQWGHAQANSSGLHVVYPIPFPNQVFTIQGVAVVSNASVSFSDVANTVGVTLVSTSEGAPGPNTRWMAIGN